MDCNVNREVAQIDLLADWSERPLIWEQNGTVGLFARKVGLNNGRLRRRVNDFDTVLRPRGAARHRQNYWDYNKKGQSAHKTAAHSGLKIANCKLKNANFG